MQQNSVQYHETISVGYNLTLSFMKFGCLHDLNVSDQNSFTRLNEWTNWRLTK